MATSSSKKKDDGQGFGVFRKGDDGPTVIAYTVQEAVSYRFEGWQEIAPASAENKLDEPQPAE